MARSAANTAKVKAAAAKAGPASKAKKATGKRTRTLTKAQQANRALRNAGWYLHPVTHSYVKATPAGRKKMVAAHKRIKGKPLSAAHKKAIALGVKRAWQRGKRKNGTPALYKSGKPGKIKTVSAAAHAKMLAKLREERKAARSEQRSKAKAASAGKKKPAARKPAAKKTATRKTTKRTTSRTRGGRGAAGMPRQAA